MSKTLEKINDYYRGLGRENEKRFAEEVYSKITINRPHAEVEIFQLLQDEIIEEKNKRKNMILNLDYSKKRIEANKFKVKNKNNINRFVYDFCPIMHALEEAYGFSFRDIYGKFRIPAKIRNKIIKDNFGFTDEDIINSNKFAPTSGNFCSQLILIFDILTRDTLPYSDHWHYI
jgi:hypothetical protein